MLQKTWNVVFQSYIPLLIILIIFLSFSRLPALVLICNHLSAATGQDIGVPQTFEMHRHTVQTFHANNANQMCTEQ